MVGGSKHVLTDLHKIKRSTKTNGVYRCLCAKRKNTQYRMHVVVKSHLYWKEFVKDYWYYIGHAEVNYSKVGVQGVHMACTMVAMIAIITNIIKTIRRIWFTMHFELIKWTWPDNPFPIVRHLILFLNQRNDHCIKSLS